MPQQLSVEEIRAVAAAAISARSTATQAKDAADAAGGSDEQLNQAAIDADSLAKDAEAKALTLSQAAPEADPEKGKKVAKLLRKKAFIDRDLQNLGVDVGEEDEDAGEADLDQPVTRRELNEMRQREAAQTTLQMAEAIEDEPDKQAVIAALAQVVPSGDSAKDFKAAVAIANIDRNSKILEEAARATAPRTAPTRTGAAPKRSEPFEPTAEEQMYMRAPFNLSQADILKARAGK